MSEPLPPGFNAAMDLHNKIQKLIADYVKSPEGQSGALPFPLVVTWALAYTWNRNLCTMEELEKKTGQKWWVEAAVLALEESMQQVKEDMKEMFNKSDSYNKILEIVPKKGE